MYNNLSKLIIWICINFIRDQVEKYIFQNKKTKVQIMDKQYDALA